MEIKLNKTFSIVLILLLIILNVFAIPSILLVDYFLNIDGSLRGNLNGQEITIETLKFILPNIDHIAVGIWLYFSANDENRNKLTWFLIGLIYGKTAIIAFILSIIFNRSQTQIDYFNSLKSLLVLFLITYLLTIGEPIISDTFNLNFVTKYIFETIPLSLLYAYVNFLTYSVLMGLNIVLAVQLNKWAIKLNVKRRVLWVICTVFLGLLPIILFNEIILAKREKPVLAENKSL